MAIQDLSITLKGSTAAVASVQISPQPDGSSVLVVVGAVADATGVGHQLSPARVQIPPGVAAIDNLLARALTELRKANGLEV